jgi:hypothetical protein
MVQISSLIFSDLKNKIKSALKSKPSGHCRDASDSMQLTQIHPKGVTSPNMQFLVQEGFGFGAFNFVTKFYLNRSTSY